MLRNVKYMANLGPCYRCEYRQVGCHAYCKAYKQAKKQMEISRERRIKNSKLRAYAHENRERMRRRGDIKL